MSLGDFYQSEPPYGDFVIDALGRTLMFDISPPPFCWGVSGGPGSVS